MNGIGFLILVLLGAAAVWSAVYPWEFKLWPNGRADMPSPSSPSPSAPGAASVTYAADQEPTLPTIWCHVPRAAATRSTTSDQLTASATPGAAIAPSNGSAADTAQTSYSLINPITNGAFLAPDPRDTSRLPVHFFSSKKNLGLAKTPTTN